MLGMKAFDSSPAGGQSPLPPMRYAKRVWCLLALTALAGCQQGAFDAAALPPQYQAPALRSVENVELTQLAQSTLRSDRVYVGDELEVTVATGVEREAPPVWFLRVDERGQINVPLVGRVDVAGRTLSEAEAAIGRACIERDLYRSPIVTLAMSLRRTNRITVMGAVESPGVYELPSPSSDLLSALVAAGGLTEEADTHVDVRQKATQSRPGPISGRPAGVQQAAYAEGHGPSAPVTQRLELDDDRQAGQTNCRLQDGAVVSVATRPPRTIHVMGKVNRPDQFELPSQGDLRVLDAIALAGGRSLQVADKVRVVRTVPGRSEPVVVNLSVRAAKRNHAANVRLAPGDLVSVEETPVTFTIEMLQNLVRFGFSAAMPVF
jgi:polysaccharide export outer membrane protein